MHVLMIDKKIQIKKVLYNRIPTKIINSNKDIVI